jgi:hypothetical protein
MAGVAVSVVGVIVAVIAIFVSHADAIGGRGPDSPPPSASASAFAPSSPASSAPASRRPHTSAPSVAVPATPTVKAKPRTYYNVPLQPLCDSDGCGGSQVVGSKLFAYTDQAMAGDFPHYDTNPAFREAPTSCSEIKVQFSGDDWAQNIGSTALEYLKFVQNSGTIYTHVGGGTIATKYVPLDGGPLVIAAAIANDSGIHNNNIDLKVTGTCSTPDGVR